MPKLVYFPVQGRGQSVRYALAYTGMAFEDSKVTFDEWKVIKASGAYPEGTGLPVFHKDDGTVLNQEQAILNYICFQGGLAPQTPEAMYEMFWYWETLADHKTTGTMPAIF